MVSTFGPGAMIDLPTRSVVVGGLELWEMRGDAFTTIAEPRLNARLEQLLKQQGWLEPTKSLVAAHAARVGRSAGSAASYMVAPVFPAWFVCEQVEFSSVTEVGARRRLVRWQDLDRGRAPRFDFEDGKRSEVTPIRFVCACDNGHLQDIDWRWFVHGNRSLPRTHVVGREGHERRSGR